MDPQQEERRGEDAKRVLNEDIYKEAWQMIREKLIARLESEDLTDAKQLEMVKLIRANRLARRYLEHVVTTGTMAAMESERKRTLRDKILRRG